MIKRLDYPKNRIFPQPYKDIYKVKQESNVSSYILGLANREFSLWEGISGKKLDAKAQVGRLLYHHKMAVESEIAEKFQRADFFWNQLYFILKKIQKNHVILENFYNDISVNYTNKIFNDPIELFQCLINELFSACS